MAVAGDDSEIYLTAAPRRAALELCDLMKEWAN